MPMDWKMARYNLTRFQKNCRRQGIAYTLRKTRASVHEKNRMEQLARAKICFDDTIVSFPGKVAEKKDHSAAVHLHLYYEDLLEEFTEYLQRIDLDFDIYISCREMADRASIERYMRSRLPCAKRIVVMAVPNRGRDIAPFYVSFGDVLMVYDYVLNIHTKNSLFTGIEKSGWRRQGLVALLPGKRPVSSILGLMEQEKIGLFFADTPAGFETYFHTWLGNERRGKSFLKELGIVPDREVFNYPVGSFFWMRTDAVRKIFDTKPHYDDFERESGQTDGTFAHVLERAVSFVVRDAGYHLGIYDEREDIVRLDTSYQLLIPYFAQTETTIWKRLADFEVISFGLEGTLVEKGRVREDIRWVFRRLHRQGRRLNVVADTELRQEQVRQLLTQNGYPGINRCYLSSETGKSKEDGTLWDEYAKEYRGKLCIHVGSDPNADICQLTARMIKPFWIMTAEEMGKICYRRS